MTETCFCFVFFRLDAFAHVTIYFLFFTGRMCDMIYGPSKLSPNTEPSLNSRAAFVCGKSPVDLSGIRS